VAFVTSAPAEQATDGDMSHGIDRLVAGRAPPGRRRDARGNERALGLLPVSFSGSKQRRHIKNLICHIGDFYHFFV